MRRTITFFCLLFLISGNILAQEKKTIAVKTSAAPKIDGALDDPEWQQAPVLTDFIQNFPSFGQKATKPTEVRILYDDNSIYVGAMIYDDPALIRKQITARDAESQTNVDYFSVFFDTYHDHQNGFQFLVTTANVQTDAKLAPNIGGDFNSFGDRTWDAVWESQVKMLSNGWSVEMRIPYISLRFAKKDIQEWGLQLLRYTRRLNESSYWSPVDPGVNGFVNQFGTLSNLKDIKPPLRLSFSPYVTTGYRSSPQPNGYLNEWLRNGGMDVKYGINESFTLDATLIPDFGQVISDNVINNLTPYEVRFTENRQFFTEGTEIFNKANLFYSRRVGATPPGYSSVRGFVLSNPEWELIKNPSITQLYNATKFSGRNKHRLGIGVFNAVTAPMHAKLRNRSTGKDSTIETSPLTNYNIFVLDQALKGRSYVTFTNTNVMRSGGSRDANVSAFDVALYDKNNKHALNGTVRYSKIWGADPYDGYNTTLKFGKVSGNWQYYVMNNIESAKYDPNDLGILLAPNEISYKGSVSYRSFQPTDKFITYSYSITPTLRYTYQPYAFNKFDVSASSFWVFKNFWDISLVFNVTPGKERDYFELRTPGKYLSYPVNYIIQMSGSSDSRKKLYWRYGGIYAFAPDYNNYYTSVSLGGRYRFSNKLSLDLQTDSHFEHNQLGYAFVRETNGDPIVGFRNNRDYTTVLSGIYNFTSRMNLTLRARHYWNRVNYNNFHDVDSKGMLTDRSYINGLDENFNVFNLDAFYTWDFRLGSRLILGYKNWLGNDEMVTPNGHNTYLYNLGKMLDLRHGNEVTVRFIYFLDYNQLRK